MTLHLANITFDCDDALVVGGFWSAALGRPLDPEASEHFASIGMGERRDTAEAWLFAQVPEPKTAKNRCHVDFHTDDRDAVAREVERLVALGATMIRPPKEEFGTYWATLQDPEGNEFCIGAS